MLSVHFVYHVGLMGTIFRNARLVGSWDADGNYVDLWTSVAMTEARSEYGTQCFRATIQLDESGIGRPFRWGVLIDGPGGPNQWGIVTEVHDAYSRERYRDFVLREDNQTEEYHLTHCRRLGANKLYRDGSEKPAVHFSVWAPNARAVEVVFGDKASGYIADDGTGAVSQLGDFPMTKDERTGIWKTSVDRSPALARFADFDHKPYMYRITKDDGTTAYRTDLYSRCQIGSGSANPNGAPYSGTPQELDGSVSCSVVVNPEQVTKEFEMPFAQEEWTAADEFWRDEFDPLRPLPSRIEDLVIYELHVGGLGYGKQDDNGKPLPGTLKDAIGMLDYLVDLGVNTIELLPMNEFEGWMQWGYGTSHFQAIEYSGGGRDQFKHFVRECHRRGIAVILDVVYNHYDHEAERAEWMYDSNAHEQNIYYWYEGVTGNYPEDDGGYIDNQSTGYAPRYWEEMVRKMFVSSAVALAHEFHLDGFRVDQTTSIHSYAVLHANGHPADQARIFGAKFLRELTMALKLVKPNVFLIAEDHSGWSAVTQPVDAGGLGFDAIWYADFYHHLIGDTDQGADKAKLIKTAGFGDNRPLAMDYFAGALDHASERTVVYHESHDEAGNGKGTGRTIAIAVNRAPLWGETRRCAEARCRAACGLNLLSAGIPMFFMGEEIGFQNDYTYDHFESQREDFAGKRDGDGAALFRFYQDLIRLRHTNNALRSPQLDILHVHNDNRVLVFRRWHGGEQLLVFVSLNDRPFAAGYGVANPRLPDAAWREIFNSDAAVYGGDDVGNGGLVRLATGGFINAVIPAHGFVVLRKVD